MNEERTYAMSKVAQIVVSSLFLYFWNKHWGFGSVHVSINVT
jgi:putative flippase GtrA